MRPGSPPAPRGVPDDHMSARLAACSVRTCREFREVLGKFAAGQKVDARVIQFDRRTRKVQVSIKALEVAEEKCVFFF